MKIRNISPNNVIKVIKIEEKKDFIVLHYLDESGFENNAKLIIESDDTVGDTSVQQKSRNATLEDWNKFLDMLGETSFPDSTADKLKIQIQDEIDAKMESLDAKIEKAEEAGNEDEVAKLEEESKKLRKSKKQIIEDALLHAKEEAINKSVNRSLFHVGGIQLFNKDGKDYKSIEIPHPNKKSRNIKTINTKYPYLLFSFYKKADNSPLKYSEVKTIDFKEVKMSAKVSELTEKSVFKDIFAINDNVLDKMYIDGIEVDSEGKNHSSMYRLIQVTAKEDTTGICDALKDFRDKYKKVDKNKKFLKKDIDNLKKHYAALLELIENSNGIPKGYNLYLNLQSNSLQRRTLAEKMLEDVNSNIDALTGDYRSVTFLGNTYFTNILGAIKVPKVKKGSEEEVEPRTVWYIESSLGTNIEPPKESGSWCQGFVSKQIEHFIRNSKEERPAS